MSGPSHLFCPACRPLSPRKWLTRRRLARTQETLRDEAHVAWARALARDTQPKETNR